MERRSHCSTWPWRFRGRSQEEVGPYRNRAAAPVPPSSWQTRLQLRRWSRLRVRTRKCCLRVTRLSGITPMPETTTTSMRWKTTTRRPRQTSRRGTIGASSRMVSRLLRRASTITEVPRTIPEVLVKDLVKDRRATILNSTSWAWTTNSGISKLHLPKKEMNGWQPSSNRSSVLFR